MTIKIKDLVPYDIIIPEYQGEKIVKEVNKTKATEIVLDFSGIQALSLNNAKIIAEIIRTRNIKIENANNLVKKAIRYMLLLN